jgi:hypothetical protein
MSEEMDYLGAAEKRTRKRSPWLRAGLALSLGLNGSFLVRIDHQSRDIASMEQRLQNEITRLSDATSGGFEVEQQRFLKIEAALEPDKKILHPAQSADAPVRQSATSLHAAVVEQRKDIAARESDRTHPDAREKEDDARTQSGKSKGRDESESLDAHVTAQVPSARTDSTTVLTAANAKSVSIPIERTDAGKPKEVPAISSAVAIKSSVASATKEERTFFDLDLIKEKMGQTVGDIRIVLTKSDTKHNRFTLHVVVAGKAIEKRDQAVNEPVEVYVPGRSQPYEIVIKTIRRDEVIGSVAMPNSNRASRLDAQAASVYPVH